jgi:vitamin B12 transporter
MKRFLGSAIAVWLAVFTLAGCLLLQAAFARAGELGPGEEEILQMYFSDDRLVESSTGHAKPLSQIAENVTVITAADIEAMNAHTLDEVLNLVPGDFVGFRGRDFANSAVSRIHASDYEHVLVLVDGIRWNMVSNQYALLNAIPVQIVDRVEVIKGATSSMWGSALGGAINIITKDPGTSLRPKGTASLSYGERDSKEYGADAAGKAGPLGYYLYAGSRDSDGIRDDRFYDGDSLYGKVRLDFPRDIALILTMGYIDPYWKDLHAEALDWKERIVDRNFFYTANLDVPLMEGLGLNLSAYGRENRDIANNASIATGEPWSEYLYDGESHGGAFRLVWQQAHHTMVFGAEIERNSEDDSEDISGYEADTLYEENKAVYLNDTWRWDNLTITPGLRYDEHSLSSDLVNPSLGITYRLGEETIFRLSAARGFRRPGLGFAKGDPLIYGTSNPDLRPEKTTTYQCGVETWAARYLRLKATLFLHDSKHVWAWDDDQYLWVNNGKYRRSGVELEAETVPFHNLSLAANHTYVYQNPEDGEGAYVYKTCLILRYDDRRSLSAQLMGHYVWWGTISSPRGWGGDYDSFLWDFALTKKVLSGPPVGAEVFFTARNIFNGSNYADEFFPTAPRWIEAGLRLRF